MMLDDAEREKRRLARQRKHQLKNDSISKEMSAAKRAAGLTMYQPSTSHAERDWLRQLGQMPEDRRSLTGRMFGDPISGDPRTPWRPRNVSQ